MEERENVSERGEIRARVEDREPNYMGAGGEDRVFVGEKKMKILNIYIICVVSSSKPKWPSGEGLTLVGALVRGFETCFTIKGKFWKNIKG